MKYLTTELGMLLAELAQPRDHCRAEGTSRYEIVGPCFFQPSLNNHVVG